VDRKTAEMAEAAACRNLSDADARRRVQKLLPDPIEAKLA
jgi:hypothetical protein